MAFKVSTYEGIPVLTIGKKQVQNRDERGRFTSGFTEIDDPDYEPITTQIVDTLSRVYILSLPSEIGDI